MAIKAGIGAACGLAYAMGGGAKEIQRAVKIMAAALSGVICDGAKPGCALNPHTTAAAGGEGQQSRLGACINRLSPISTLHL
ncbi:MAG: L-serine ammonia-lyase, iron-sulfur-dependent, subunit alpha [Acidobacteriota bacterium]